MRRSGNRDGLSTFQLCTDDRPTPNRYVSMDRLISPVLTRTVATARLSDLSMLLRRWKVSTYSLSVSV